MKTPEISMISRGLSWRARRDSNPRSSESESDALSTRPRALIQNHYIINHMAKKGKCKFMTNFARETLSLSNAASRTHSQARDSPFRASVCGLHEVIGGTIPELKRRIWRNAALQECLADAAVRHAGEGVHLHVHSILHKHRIDVIQVVHGEIIPAHSEEGGRILHIREIVAAALETWAVDAQESVRHAIIRVQLVGFIAWEMVGHGLFTGEIADAVISSETVVGEARRRHVCGVDAVFGSVFADDAQAARHVDAALLLAPRVVVHPILEEKP